MAVGLPLKTTYANGDVYSASDVNDTNGTINITAAPYAAGKNKIINGDFFVNQRAFTSNTVQASYNFDRWLQQNSGGTFTLTPQTFTTGAAPATPYEGRTYLQGITASQSAVGDYAIHTQKIENVTTLAGATATISFWAKANTGTPKIGVELEQVFGSGGSPSAAVSTPAGAVTLTTSWARYSVTIAVPSISGKTIGTTANTSTLSLNLWQSAGSTYATRASSIGIQNYTLSIWGVQVEQGSTATAFQTATGTIQGELAACQRYYYASDVAVLFLGNVTNGGTYYYATYLPVPMRVAPTTVTTAVSGVVGFPSSNPSTTSVGKFTFWAYLTSNNTGVGNFQFNYTASAEL